MSNRIIELVWMVVVLLISFSPVATFASQQLEPIDQSSEDASFAAFKKTLATALQKKDAIFIKSILMSDVSFSFGHEEGTAVSGFLAHYKVQNKSSDFWKDLKVVLSLGCARLGDGFECPYLSSKWPDRIDPFSHVVATRTNVALRVKPKMTAKIIKNVTFEFLKKTKTKSTRDWIAIEMENKQIGYVLKSDVRSSVDCRAEPSRV